MSERSVDAREVALLDAIRAAGREVLSYLTAPARLEVGRKGPQDFVSAADSAVERLLKERLLGAFPTDDFLGEETAGKGSGRVGARLWVVDPIDGTANFVRLMPHFCISVAFLCEGEMTLGAILDPVRDELYVARRGHGATRNGASITVAPTRAMNEAMVEIGWSPRIQNARYLTLLGNVLAAGPSVRRGGSGALGLAYVADGRSDAYAELHINAWDCLAGLLLVREAGGRISPFLASGGLALGGPVLAATPGIADAMSELTGISLEES
ncbi:MAG TPA: inositol monophosphatase family protein [Acetobacteraceae bacterium]|nr:inositol monophosphatase family protein [Acetobacteraceae bacterium]